jgi:heterodisulfide reductase subunit B
MNRDYRESLVQASEALGLQLIELDDWTCCGATAAHSLDERMSVILPARNLAGAEALELDLAVACPMCFKRLKYCRNMIEEQRIEDPWAMSLSGAIVDLARLLATDSMIERIGARVRAPLTGLRVVCYYGCQVVRPPKITGYQDYENPTHLDRIAEAVGATALDWSFKATCCGAGMGIPKKEIGLELVDRLLNWARAAGAQAIVVCCPLCHSNLDLYQPALNRRDGRDPGSREMPVLYYTELLGIAFDLPGIRNGFKNHLVDPSPLIDRIREQQKRPGR